LKSSSVFLWQLIHSLSSNEKLFFKRNYSVSVATEQRLYIKLFDAIAAQKKYDEAAILRKFNPALNKKNIATQKHYLQQQVCNALIEYDGRNNPTHEIYNQIQLIRVYRKKGLIEEANTLWKKAVVKARETESYALLNLLKTEFEKMILFSSAHISYDELHSIFQGNIITYNEYAEMITLRDIYAETLLLKRKAHFDLDDNLVERINSLLQKVDKSRTEIPTQSFWFHHYYIMSRASLLYLQNKIPESFKLFEQLLITWKNNSSFIKTNGEHYIELLYMINYAGILHGSYKYVTDVFSDKINDVIEEPVQRANLEIIKFLALNKIYNKTARYDEVEKLIKSIAPKYKYWEPLINADMNRTVCLSLSIAFFVLEQFDNALFYSKRAVSYYNDGTRDEHQAIGHILLLLITYNLNNSKLFDAQYRNTYTYFYKRKKKHPFETTLVQCLHRTFYMTDTKSKIAEYQKALEVFNQNKDDVVQQLSFGIFNYPGWLISKTQRIPYRQYVERKVKETSIA